MVRFVALPLFLAVAACAASPSSPRLMAECTKLFNMWARYEQHWTFHHTGQRAKAELALEDCRHDQYEKGITELRRLLKRGRFELPEVTLQP